MARKYGLKMADFELLMELYSLEKFTRQDFLIGAITGGFDNHKWKRLYRPDGSGMIVMWRSKASKCLNGTQARYNIYELSQKAKRMVNDTYKICCGEKEIPLTERSNEIMKGKTLSDRAKREAIIQMSNKHKFW